MIKTHTHGIVPPYMLTELIRRNPTEKHFLETLNETKKLRETKRSYMFPWMPGLADRSVYDAKNEFELPGVKVRGEYDVEVDDESANRAFNLAGKIRRYYKEVHNRNSFDNNGMEIVSTVHYGRKYANAFWNSRQMVYGDGDGVIFKDFISPPDVAAHECRHAVTQYCGDLIYEGQSGAINESISDVFGVLFKQWLLGLTADQSDWLIGVGLFMPDVKARGLRDMLNPGTAYDDVRLGRDPQPAHMKQYRDVEIDNGGVHFNSGIPNRAFALFAKAVGGYAWEKAGQIWFLAGTYCKPNTEFFPFADMTVKAARNLYAEDTMLVRKLKNSWAQVGIYTTA